MIVLISGTNRPSSKTRAVVAQVEAIYRELKVEFNTLDLAELPQEIFNPSSYEKKPDSFEAFSKGVLEADGLVVVTPEYNGGAPGILKYFIDMLKFPESFERCPVCFVGLAAGMWGGMRPVEQLQQVFGYRNALVYPGRVFLPKIFELLDDTGQLKDSGSLERLKTQAVGFIEFVEKLKSVTIRPSD